MLNAFMNNETRCYFGWINFCILQLRFVSNFFLIETGSLLSAELRKRKKSIFLEYSSYLKRKRKNILGIGKSKIYFSKKSEIFMSELLFSNNCKVLFEVFIFVGLIK